jgi:hypothetical protein
MPVKELLEAVEKTKLKSRIKELETCLNEAAYQVKLLISEIDLEDINPHQAYDTYQGLHKVLHILEGKEEAEKK